MKMNIQLPSFHGTYNTIWDDDDNWYYEMEHNMGIEHLDGWEFNFKGWLTDLGMHYSDFIEDAYRRNIYDGISLEFEATTSPREYNFSTDKIYADLTIEDDKSFEARIKQLMDENKEELSDIIYDNHTSRSGFISFMSNDFDEWKESFMTDELIMAHLLCYLAAILEFDGDVSRIDYFAYEWSVIYRESYWYPSSDEAIAEWDEYQRKEEEKAWDREHLLELPFTYA